MDITVDAHATRLLREVSPPEACVDPSLGPYVTSALRASPGPAAARDLVELVEGHCQISTGAARDVLSRIALAVRTGDVSLDADGGAAAGGVGGGDGGGADGSAVGLIVSTRSRSKSLGAEPAYDAEFLGRVLREAAVARSSDRPGPRGDAVPPLLGSLNLNTSCAFAPKNERTRSVTFDETFTWYPSSPTVLSTPSPERGGILEEQPEAFGPLEGILGVLDLEGEEEMQGQTAHGLTVGSSDAGDGSGTEKFVSSNDSPAQSLGINRSDVPHGVGLHGEPSLPPKHAGGKKEKPCRSEADDLAAALFRPSQRPRSSSLAERKSHRPPPQRGANDLSASLFRPSQRPRSNSHADQRRGPSSPTLAPSPRNSPPGTSRESPPSSGPGDVCGIVLNKDNRFSAPQATWVPTDDARPEDSAELRSTVQLLLTLNSHLGRDAASLAARLTDGDLNLAQYLIEAARSDASNPSPRSRRSRLCRHELRGTCYRADCPYSHDFSGVTCLFWLRGRCREGNCRFSHGFAEGLLEGVCKEYLVEQRARKREEEEAKLGRQQEEEEDRSKIHTANLLDYNQWSADRFSSPSCGSSAPNGSPPPLFGNGCWTSFQLQT